MIWALLAVALVAAFGGGGSSPYWSNKDFKEFRKVTKEIVVSEEDTDQIMDAVKDLQKIQKKYYRDLDKIDRRIVKLEKKYDTSREDLEAELAKLNALRDQFLEDYLDVSERIKTAYTEEEWAVALQIYLDIDAEEVAKHEARNDS